MEGEFYLIERLIEEVHNGVHDMVREKYKKIVVVVVVLVIILVPTKILSHRSVVVVAQLVVKYCLITKSRDHPPKKNYGT